MRANLIAERLTQAFRGDFGCAVAVVEAATWLLLPVEPRFRFGYMPPVPVTNVGDQFLVSLSAELIDRVTVDLDDDTLDAYLTAVEAFVGAHLMSPDKSSDETMRYVENELYEKAPDALALMTEVEAQAIDAGIVARLP